MLYIAISRESSRPGIYGYKVGEHIVFSTCYASSTDPISKAIQASNMVRNHGVITRIRGGARNPYLLDNGLCWVNDQEISVDCIRKHSIIQSNLETHFLVLLLSMELLTRKSHR